MSIVTIALRIYPSNSHSIVTLFFIVYVYNNVLRYYSDELLDSIEVSNTEDASRKKGLWYLILLHYLITWRLTPLEVLEYCLSNFERYSVI